MTTSTATFRSLPIATTLLLLGACAGEEASPADMLQGSSTGATSSATPDLNNTGGTMGSDGSSSSGGSFNPADEGVATGGSPETSGTTGGAAGLGGAVNTGEPAALGGAAATDLVGGAGGVGTMVSTGAGGMNTGGAGTTVGGSGGVSATSGAGTGGMTASGGAGGVGGANADAPSALPPTDDYSDFGPFESTDESGTGPDGMYTIVRPQTLGEDGFLHAPLIFGPGINGAPSSMMRLLERVASHGFVIISRELNGGPGDAENNRRMTDGLDWLIEQNTTAGSMFEGKLDVTRAVSMGYSVGATAAVDVGGHDPIVTAVAIHGHGAEPIEDASGTTFLLMGGTQDFNRNESWLAPTFEALEEPTFFSLVEGAEHGYPGQTVDGVPGGVQTPALIAWIRYWVYNDQEAKKYFVGDDCVMCQPPWTDTQRKNWPDL